MSLHFLLKAEARTRSLVEVLGMSDDDAFTLFRRVRWGDGDEVICPHCGLVHRHYFRPARQIWRCVGCQEDFSVTSGTIFAFHKHHALAFPRPEEAVPRPVFLGAERPQVDFRGKQLEGRLQVGQINCQSPHFLPVMLVSPAISARLLTRAVTTWLSAMKNAPVRRKQVHFG
jgi:hypothetical protein